MANRPVATVICTASDLDALKSVFGQMRPDTELTQRLEALIDSVERKVDDLVAQDNYE